jgi:ADP-heptose:LPS heptosyltransferase
MNPAPESILAFRNGSIGNTLVAVPALRALRRRYPQARLTVVVDPVGDELLAHCPWIDARIVYDRRGRDRGLAAWLRLVGRLRAVHPRHAVLFSASSATAAGAPPARVRPLRHEQAGPVLLTHAPPTRRGANIA